MGQVSFAQISMSAHWAPINVPPIRRVSIRLAPISAIATMDITATVTFVMVGCLHCGPRFIYHHAILTLSLLQTSMSAIMTCTTIAATLQIVPTRLLATSVRVGMDLRETDPIV